MVNGHTGQKIRTRKFQARNERIETAVLVKRQKGKMSAKGDACSFRRDDSKRGKNTQSFSLSLSLQDRKHKLTKKPSNGKSPRCSSLSGKGFRKPCRHYFKGNWTNPSCDFWHPPACQTYKSELDANSAKNVLHHHVVRAVAVQIEVDEEQQRELQPSSFEIGKTT